MTRSRIGEWHARITGEEARPEAEALLYGGRPPYRTRIAREQVNRRAGEQ